MNRKILFFQFLFLLPVLVWAQKTKRLEPGKMYDAGETLFAPTYGFRATVPPGWTGILPRESEVFLLSSTTSPAEIFVLARPRADLGMLKEIWEEGIEMDGNIRIQGKGVTLVNGVLSGRVVGVGSFIDKSKSGFAIARCANQVGPCVTCLAIMPAAQYEEVKKVAEGFMNSATFEPPSVTSLYSDFVWKEFLTNHMVTTYAFVESGSKETNIHFCADGTFSANVSKKGIFKNLNPQYKGKLSGTWSAEGVGERGKLSLAFNKGQPPLSVELLIRDEKIFAGEDRYFVGVSDRCK